MLSIDLNRLAIEPGWRVLDIGCGTGRHAAAIAGYEAVHVVAADISLTDLAQAGKRLVLRENLEGKKGSWDLLAASITRLPFADALFDLIVCSEILEHVHDHRRAAAELARILKPGGQLVVSVPRFLPERICWALSKDYRTSENGHIRIYRKQDLIGLLKREGLTGCSLHYAHSLHTPYWWLKCLLGPNRKDVRLVNLYHDLLTWDIMQRPRITRFLDRLFNPLLGKSLVVYLRK